MSLDSKPSRFVSGLGGMLFALVFVWGETVGLVHAFRQHGSNDGWNAVYVMPMAWWRGVEFFFHEKADSGGGPDEEWPELNPQELSIISEITGKAMVKPLTDEDLAQIRQVGKSYMERVGRPWNKREVELFLKSTELTYKYNYELGRCLLHSIDGGSPFISNELKRLRLQMEETGLTRKSKLDSDFRSIIATGKGTTYTDEFGEIRSPLRREGVLAGFQKVELIKTNMEKMSLVYRELAEGN